ncbi:hypothetical protein [Novosphingobium olei]|uniref:Uncharacterized protein n=1 Tax=Novosphingobium olei TaxID=2728851 RepID=A0A7Y0BTJ5_9SPHN|nr:hypothetical protein [Novosphingobium olei]NML96329.1 hypothetical protein [Novosphingobium olei]
MMPIEPPLLTALQGRRIQIMPIVKEGITFRDISYPYAHLHRRMNSFLLECIKITKSVEEDLLHRESGESSGINTAAAGDYLLLCAYTMAEMCEFYTRDVEKFLGTDALVKSGRLLQAHRDAYRHESRKLTSEWSTICNKSKHNYLRLMPVDIFYSDGNRASCYTPIVNDAGSLSVFKTQDLVISVYSHAWALRRLVSNIFCLELAVHKLIANIEDDPSLEELAGPIVGLPYGSALSGLAQLSHICSPEELESSMLQVFDSGDPSWISMVDNSAMPDGIKCTNIKSTIYVDILSNEKVISLPFLNGGNPLSVKLNSTEGVVLRGFQRLVISDEFKL